MDWIPKFPDLSLETPLWEAGVNLVAGLDEAGRGAWAGPVTAAAVILPPDAGVLERLQGVRDSKCMTALQRETWAKEIKRFALAWQAAHASNGEIEEVGIVQATRLAMQRALQGLAVRPAHLLLDAVALSEETLPQTILFKGDALSLSIAAASVIAKTERDAVMMALDADMPGYGFARHKGYGTPEHSASLNRLGPCAIHRRNYEPIRISLEKSSMDQPIQS